jgi:hypothetical protein
MRNEFKANGSSRGRLKFPAPMAKAAPSKNVAKALAQLSS